MHQRRIGFVELYNILETPSDRLILNMVPGRLFPFSTEMKFAPLTVHACGIYVMVTRRMVPGEESWYLYEQEKSIYRPGMPNRSIA